MSVKEHLRLLLSIICELRAYVYKSIALLNCKKPLIAISNIKSSEGENGASVMKRAEKIKVHSTDRYPSGSEHADKNHTDCLW